MKRLFRDSCSVLLCGLAAALIGCAESDDITSQPLSDTTHQTVYAAPAPHPEHTLAEDIEILVKAEAKAKILCETILKSKAHVEVLAKAIADVKANASAVAKAAAAEAEKNQPPDAKPEDKAKAVAQAVLEALTAETAKIQVEIDAELKIIADLKAQLTVLVDLCHIMQEEKHIAANLDAMGRICADAEARLKALSECLKECVHAANEKSDEEIKVLITAIIRIKAEGVHIVIKAKLKASAEACGESMAKAFVRAMEKCERHLHECERTCKTAEARCKTLTEVILRVRERLQKELDNPKEDDKPKHDDDKPKHDDDVIRIKLELDANLNGDMNAQLEAWAKLLAEAIAKAFAEGDIRGEDLQDDLNLFLSLFGGGDLKVSLKVVVHAAPQAIPGGATVERQTSGTVELGPEPIRLKLADGSEVAATVELTGRFTGKATKVEAASGLANYNIRFDTFDGSVKVSHTIEGIPSPFTANFAAGNGMMQVRDSGSESQRPFGFFAQARTVTFTDANGAEIALPRELFGTSPNTVAFHGDTVLFAHVEREMAPSLTYRHATVAWSRIKANR